MYGDVSNPSRTNLLILAWPRCILVRELGPATHAVRSPRLLPLPVNYMKPKRSANRQPCGSRDDAERQGPVPSQSHPLNLSQVRHGPLMQAKKTLCVPAYTLNPLSLVLVYP